MTRAWSVSGRVAVAAVAAVLLWSLTRRAWAGRVARCVAWLPLALLAGEGIENMLLALLAWSYPTEMPWMVQAASAVTRVKLVVGVFVLIAIVASILAGALRRDPHGAGRAG